MREHQTTFGFASVLADSVGVSLTHGFCGVLLHSEGTRRTLILSDSLVLEGSAGLCRTLKKSPGTLLHTEGFCCRVPFGSGGLSYSTSYESTS